MTNRPPAKPPVMHSMAIAVTKEEALAAGQSGMTQIVPASNQYLYHGTLRQNLQSIRNIGLQPRRGGWVARFHPSAVPLVYAVDDEHRSAATVAITGQMAKAGLVQQSDNYSFDDFKKNLIEHGAIIVVKAATFRSYPWSFESGHPTGAEPGNWYSSEPVNVESEMIGEEMLAWLKPSEGDFIYRYRPAIDYGATP